MRKEWKFDALSSELYVVQTTWPLDYHVNIVFIPCMGCILVGVRCLLDTLQFCGFGGHLNINFQTSLSKIFEGHGLKCRDQIWWKSAVVKLPKYHLVLRTKKPVARNTTEPRFCPHLADSAQNFQNVVVPLHFGPDRFRLAGVIPERLICSDPQSHYNVMYGLGLSA